MRDNGKNLQPVVLAITFLFPVNWLIFLIFLPVQNTPVPKAEEFKVDSFQFDDFSLEPDQMLQASLRMFIDCGFIDEFHIDYEVQISSSLIKFYKERFAYSK